MSEYGALLDRARRQFDVPEMPLENVLRRRDRKRRNQRLLAGAVGLVFALVAILAASAVLRSKPQPAAPPTPARRIVLVTPLCGHPPYQALLPAPFNGPGLCPRVTPAGRYASALVGLHQAWPFTFTLPDGWEVADIPEGNGLELRVRGTDLGLSIIVYPGGPRSPAIESGNRLAQWVTERPNVVASSVTRVEFDGGPAWQVDVRPADGARAVSGCPVGIRCVPLLHQMFGPQSIAPYGEGMVAALLPNTTSRLIFFGQRGLSSVVWIWNVSGRSGAVTSDELLRVAASLHFEGRPCC